MDHFYSLFTNWIFGNWRWLSNRDSVFALLAIRTGLYHSEQSVYPQAVNAVQRAVDYEDYINRENDDEYFSPILNGGIKFPTDTAQAPISTLVESVNA